MLVMLGSWDALQVAEPVVCNVLIPMMDVTALRDRAERSLPNVSVKVPLALEVPTRRPNPIDAPLKNLREWVSDDWIMEPGRRLSADLHPSTVKNK
jgi:hypothetical protein